LARSSLDFQTLGRTVDDAAGEAFDKSAKLMGLGYPGGRIVEEMAEGGDPAAFQVARPMLGRGLDFSFSGLKTRIRELYQARGMDLEPPGSQALKDLAASFQAAVIDVLVDKAGRAAREKKVKTVVLSGGVAANQALRREAQRRLGAEGVRVLAARPSWCADNGAMIAYLGDFQLAAGANPLGLSDEPKPRWPVGE
jgi:N6-L-threonylcarbamoyladenine synthase